MPRRKRGESISTLKKKWEQQDVNKIIQYDKHECRLPNDFTDWSALHGEVVPVVMTKEELDEYISKRSR